MARTSSDRAAGAGALFVAAAVVVSSAGCFGGHGKSSAPRVPPQRLAKFVPPNYRVTHVYRGQLSSGNVSDEVVTSVGPPTGDLNFHPADLQVLSWDAIAKRWLVAFDAEKVEPSQSFNDPTSSNSGITGPALAAPSQTTPILDPKADVTIQRVDFVRFGGVKRTALVFSEASSYGGSGLPGALVVLSLTKDEAGIDYYWSGDGGVRYHVVGKPPRQNVEATAEYWTSADAHCCSVRSYRFVVGSTGQGTIGVVRDERPWLGLFVSPAEDRSPGVPLHVVGVAPGSPAAAAGLRRGDKIVAVENAPKVKNQPISLVLLDQIASFSAGERVSLDVRGAGGSRTVTVKLGSLIDESALTAAPPNSYAVTGI
jgi:PDZ domain